MENKEEKELEITVSLTLLLRVKVKTDQYTEVKDSFSTYYDLSNVDIGDLVDKQVTLPHNLAYFTESMFEEDLDLKAAGMPKYLEDAIEDCKGWYLDDFTYIIE